MSSHTPTITCSLRFVVLSLFFVQALDSRDTGPTRIGEFDSVDALSLTRARAIVAGLEGVNILGTLNARDALLAMQSTIQAKLAELQPWSK